MGSIALLRDRMTSLLEDGYVASRRTVPDQRPLSARKTARSLSVPNGPMLTFRFVLAMREASDVDVRDYPYELVRGNPANAGPGGFLNGDPFVVEFSSAYLDLVPRHQLRAKVVLGRPLFKLIRLECSQANRELSWDELQCFQRAQVYHSSWSNMCDAQAPAVRWLIEAIQMTAAHQSSEPRYEMMVGLELGRTRIAARYTMQCGDWIFKRSLVMEKEHSIRHIVLDDSVSVRVRCYSKNPPAEDEWDDPVMFDVGQNRDVWDTVVIRKETVPRSARHRGCRSAERPRSSTKDCAASWFKFGMRAWSR